MAEFTTQRGRARTYSPLPRIPLPQSKEPMSCTDAEIAAIVRLLRAMRPRPVSVVIGTAMDDVSRTNAARIAEAWTEDDELVLDTVAWPESAASWLRPARRFAGPEPDAWIVTGTPAGWIGMGRRLAYSTDWSSGRTFATAALADSALISLGGVGTFDGLRGAYPDGTVWEIMRTLIIDHDSCTP